MKNLISFFKNRNGSRDSSTEENVREGDNQQRRLDDRLADIYGKDKLALQSLYEKQVVRDTWLLKDEAIWLIAGMDPDQHGVVDDETRHKLEGLWEHARKCVEEGLLGVVNREQDPDSWEVKPVDVYQWARVSRVDLPDIFSNLMGFVSKSIKPAHAETGKNTDEAGFDRKAYEFDQDRETVLGMALAVLAAFPDQCKTGSGRIRADRIVSVIIDKEKFWLGDRKINMSSTAMRDLINRWLATVPAGN